METASVPTDSLTHSLAEIRRTPLDSLSAAQVADVVRRIVTREPGTVTVDVAAFGSSI